MRCSEERILTTHVGSLPRPAALSELFLRRERGEAIDEALLASQVEAAVKDVVEKQRRTGIDVGNDGEQPRVAFNTYVARRMRGFGGQGQWTLPVDVTDFPDFLEVYRSHRGAGAAPPLAVGEVEYTDLGEAEAECDLCLRYTAATPPPFVETFMTAASPGVIATAIGNAYYDSHERYVFAVARQMQKEYELIHAKGFVLQLDCPDLAMERVRMFKDAPLQVFQANVEMHIAAINEAIANIPRERVRLHVCWGNYEGPHTHDVALVAVLPLLYQAKVGALSIELANPRHQHEYGAFRRYPLPETMLLLPGVIDTTTNFVEHPEVVAQRIEQAVDVVGERSRVIASCDCGFGTFSGWHVVAPSVAWAKLGTLVEGARIASERLWHGVAQSPA
ncbi:MAG TPA: cobalamin-independent methionine synthase II family protein [Chloroflexota bacterium]|nr:cobalamin-independent methionine synthase II family protein [Chloroflexota bacterium]